MKIIDLPVEPRELLGSAASRRLRLTGRIPVCLYGGVRAPIHLSTTRDAFGDVLKFHSAVVRLMAGDVVQTALIRDVSWNTFGEHVEHLDLLRVEPDDEVRVRVPFHFVGVPIGTTHGGEANYAMKEVEVLARVKDMPTEMRLDVEHLEIGDAIHAGEYAYPEGVRYTGDPAELIVQVKAPKAVVVEEPAEGEGDAPDEGTAPEA